MWTDIRVALRGHLERPALGIVAVAILAVGLGLSISALSVVNALLLRPYPYPRLEQLVLVRDSRPQEGAHQRNPIASGDYTDIRRESRAFDAVAGWRPQALVVTGSGDPETIQGLAVSASFFDVLGAGAIRGRTFVRDEDQPGRDRVVVFSRRFWASRFGADPSAIGGTVTLNGRAATVVGIVADDTCYPPGVDAWIPLVATAADERERTAQRWSAIGRVKAGLSIDDARHDLDTIAVRLADRYPETNRGRRFALLPLREEQYEFTAALFLLVQASALFVLALGAANVVHLLFARLIDHQREFTIRRALGAPAARLFSLVLAEAIVLAAVGGLLGVLIAYWSLPVLRAGLPEGIARWIAGWYAIRIDRRVAAAAAVLAVATGVVLGTVSGLRLMRTIAAVPLADIGRAATVRTRGWRRTFIAAEVCLAVVLLIAAAVILRGFRQLGSAFETLRPGTLLVFSLNLPDWWYPDDGRIVDLHDRLLASIGALPGVERAALIRIPPAANVSLPPVPFTIDGRAPLSASETPRADQQVISPAAFETLVLPLVAGRVFRDGDRGAAPRVAIISQAMARRFWPNADPVGQVIHLGHMATPPVTIVGVASDLKLNWYDPEPHSVIYLPASQAPNRQMDVIVRTRVDPVRLAKAIAHAVHEVDPRQPVSGLQPFQSAVDESLAPVRVIGLLLLICGAVATLFAAIGIYGVLAHWVTSRARELGVRLALGAGAGDLTRLVLREAMQMTGLGIAVGAPLAIALARAGRSVLFGLSSPSVGIAVLVSGLTILIVAGAAVGPAWRASRTDPRVLLQSE